MGLENQLYSWRPPDRNRKMVMTMTLSWEDIIKPIIHYLLYI